MLFKLKNCENKIITARFFVVVNPLFMKLRRSFPTSILVRAVLHHCPLILPILIIPILPITIIHRSHSAPLLGELGEYFWLVSCLRHGGHLLGGG